MSLLFVVCRPKFQCFKAAKVTLLEAVLPQAALEIRHLLQINFYIKIQRDYQI